MTTIAQFNSKLKYPTVAGDAPYKIPVPTGYNFRTFDFMGWLRGLSSVANGENITAATFDGSTVFFVANKARFATKIAAATPAGFEVTDVVRSIAWNASTLAEAVANDGSITATITATLTNGTYAGTNGQPLAGAVVTNVPAGLTAVVTKTSNTVATLSFTGNATAHTAAANISNLTVTLGNTSFVGGFAEDVTNATKSNIAITFTT